MPFFKKKEYGHSSLEAVDLEMDGVDKPFWVETGSILMIEGQKAKSNNSHVMEFLYKQFNYGSNLLQG